MTPIEFLGVEGLQAPDALVRGDRRAPGREARPRRQPHRQSPPGEFLRERHDAADFLQLPGFA
jgi:hypothetical protein